MLTQDDLKKISNLLNDVTETLDSKIVKLDQKIEKELNMLEHKIESNTEFSRKAHSEIMEKLVDVKYPF